MTQKFYGKKGGIEIFYGVTKILQQQHDSKILRRKGQERLFVEKFYGMTKNSTAKA